MRRSAAAALPVWPPKTKDGHHQQEGSTMTVSRINVGARMSDIVIHNNTVYLAGQVGAPGASVTEQTKAVLASVDELLAKAGTDKTKILQAIIWLADMGTFAEMNAVWDSWVPQGHTPARATGEAKLATTDYKVEVIITAAV
jgi:enamine deaminase RidA (YjgF/YER057c/UK114 family)